MMLRGQSVSAGVPDAQGPSLWSSVGAKGAVAAVWLQSMYSQAAAVWQAHLVGTGAAWWCGRKAGPGQARVYAAGISRLGSELASLKSMQRRRIRLD